jgi:hypothetical protein
MGIYLRPSSECCGLKPSLSLGFVKNQARPMAPDLRNYIYNVNMARQGPRGEIHMPAAGEGQQLAA